VNKVKATASVLLGRVGGLASARAGIEETEAKERTARGIGLQATASLRLENRYYSRPSGSLACLEKSRAMKIVQGYSWNV